MMLGYCRVSTDEQARADRTSMGEQERVIRGIALTKGVGAYDLVLYKDPGVSGATPLRDRPDGARLLADVKPGDVVVASKLDRMFRDALDAQTVYRDFKEQGIDLILYDLGPDPVTKNGGLSKVFFQIVSVFADAERERIRERMMDGKRAKKQNGGHTGGIAPFGFRTVGSGRDAKLEVNPDEQKIVATIVSLSKEYRPYKVVKQIEALGFRDRAGSPFDTTQVLRIARRGEVRV